MNNVGAPASTPPSRVLNLSPLRTNSHRHPEALGAFCAEPRRATATDDDINLEMVLPAFR
jgi:hypothetical protein